MTDWHLSADWIFPVSGEAISGGQVQVSAAGVIQAVDAQAAFSESSPIAAEDSSVYVLTPGLVNAHAHLGLTAPEVIPRQFPAKHPKTMVRWLLDVVDWRRKQHPDAIQLGIHAAVTELLNTGTTCVNEVSGSDESFSALENLGLRALLSLELIHPWRVAQPVIEEFCNRYQTLQERCDASERVQLAFSPHSPYNVSPEAWQYVLNACTPKRVHTHLAESQAEMDWLAQEASALETIHLSLLGKRFPIVQPVRDALQYLEQYALLPEAEQFELSIAHGVYLSEAELLQLAKKNIRLAHCPRSNLYLQGRTLELPAFSVCDAFGLTLGLGTDSRLSTPDLDLRAEARAAKDLHGWRPEQLLSVMTLGGAKVLGFDEQIGSVSAGKQADLVLWRIPKTSLSPTPSKAEVLNAWLDPKTTVETVWVSGERVFHAGRPCKASLDAAPVVC